MPVKYQHFHCKDPSAMFFFRWRPHCWWLEKNTAAWNPDQHEDCVKCSNLTLSLQILSWNVVKSQKLKHLDPPASEILSFCSVFRLYVSFDWSSTEPKLPFLEIRGSCRSISFQGISKDRTLMNESLCSLSMLWRFRLGCFFSNSDMQIHAAAQIILCDRFTVAKTCHSNYIWRKKHVLDLVRATTIVTFMAFLLNSGAK